MLQPALACALAALGLAACGGHESARGPAVEVGATSYDLGTVVPGRQARGTITVRNPGDKTLVVREIRTSNPELLATLSSQRVPAGKEAQLRLLYRSNTWDYDGALTDHVLLYTNDQRKPLAVLPVSTTVKAPVSWNPRVPALNAIDSSKRKPILLARLRARGPIAVQSFLPFVGARAIPVGPEDYKIVIEPQDGIQIGNLFGMVKVLTNDTRMPSIDLPVRTQVLGNLAAVPYQFDYGIVRQGRPALAGVNLVWKPGHPVHIQKVVTHVPGAPHVRISHRGRIFRIRLSYPKAPVAWNLGGTVDVYSDDPLQPVFRIPVAGWSWGDKAATGAAIREADPAYYKMLQAVLLADDEAMPVEQVASDTLAGDRSPQTVSLLLRLAKDDNWLVRLRALKVLAYLKAQRAVDPARQALISDPVFEVRRTAAATLGQVEGKKALPDLLLSLQDDDEMVRADTCDVFRELRDPRSIPALKAALDDPEDIVKDACKQALQAMHVPVPKNIP